MLRGECQHGLRLLVLHDQELAEALHELLVGGLEHHVQRFVVRGRVFVLAPRLRCVQFAGSGVNLLRVANSVFKALKVCVLQLWWFVLCELSVLVSRLVVIRNPFLDLGTLVRSALRLQLVRKFVGRQSSFPFFIAFPFVLV